MIALGIAPVTLITEHVFCFDDEFIEMLIASINVDIYVGVDKNASRFGSSLSPFIKEAMAVGVVRVMHKPVTLPAL